MIRLTLSLVPSDPDPAAYVSWFPPNRWSSSSHVWIYDTAVEAMDGAEKDLGTRLQWEPGTGPRAHSFIGRRA